MPIGNMCMYMAHVCFYVCCSDCVGVSGNGVLMCGVSLCKGSDGCCVFCLYCDAGSCRYSCMGSMSVSSCRCCIFVFVCILWQFSMLHSA